jgi:glycine dehydrogenase
MADRIPLAALEEGAQFADRHIGPRPAELARMLDVIGAGSLEELVDQAVPDSIRDTEEIDLPPAVPEHESLAELS